MFGFIKNCVVNFFRIYWWLVIRRAVYLVWKVQVVNMTFSHEYGHSNKNASFPKKIDLFTIWSVFGVWYHTMSLSGITFLFEFHIFWYIIVCLTWNMKMRIILVKRRIHEEIVQQWQFIWNLPFTIYRQTKNSILKYNVSSMKSELRGNWNVNDDEIKDLWPILDG